MRTPAMKLIEVTGILLVTLVLAIGCAQGPKAESPEEFYRGKTINWVVSSGQPGVIDDLLARAVAPYLAKEIGATVRIENMGTDEGLNYVFTEAKRDGLTMVIKSSNAVISNDILKAPGVLYEIDKFIYLADLYPGGTVFQASTKLRGRTLEALRQTKGLKGGGTTAKGAFAINNAVTFEILGLDGKVITGFPSKKEMILALGRGEADFMVGSDTTAITDEQEGFITTLFAMSERRSPALPDLPTIFELGVKIPADLEAAHKFIGGGGFATELPPEVPADRVEYLRKVFDKLGNDQVVQAEVAKITGFPRPFLAGKEVQENMAILKAKKGLAEQLDSILAKYKAAQ
ncbi:MAG: hypothetical protein HYY30_11305 [Chloroflexi bacterium]|nr:hypothetical protein [Chloroflexota bacterium]